MTRQQVGFIYHALEEFTKINQTHRLGSKVPSGSKVHLTAENRRGGEGYPPADPAPPAPLYVSDSEETELWRCDRVATS
jgi:hypothetical protein